MCFLYFNLASFSWNPNAFEVRKTPRLKKRKRGKPRLRNTAEKAEAVKERPRSWQEYHTLKIEETFAGDAPRYLSASFSASMRFTAGACGTSMKPNIVRGFYRAKKV